MTHDWLMRNRVEIKKSRDRSSGNLCQPQNTLEVATMSLSPLGPLAYIDYSLIARRLTPSCHYHIPVETVLSFSGTGDDLTASTLASTMVHIARDWMTQRWKQILPDAHCTRKTPGTRASDITFSIMLVVPE